MKKTGFPRVSAQAVGPGSLPETEPASSTTQRISLQKNKHQPQQGGAPRARTHKWLHRGLHKWLKGGSTQGFILLREHHTKFKPT